MSTTDDEWAEQIDALAQDRDCWRERAQEAEALIAQVVELMEKHKPPKGDRPEPVLSKERLRKDSANRKITQAQGYVIQQARAQGASVRKLAQEYGVSQNTIYNYLRRG